MKIEIDVEGTVKMVIEKDAKGKVARAYDDQGRAAASGDVGELTLNGKPIVDIPDGTIIRTKHNPTCVWYFFGGTWYRVCS